MSDVVGGPASGRPSTPPRDAGGLAFGAAPASGVCAPTGSGPVGVDPADAAVDVTPSTPSTPSTPKAGPRQRVPLHTRFAGTPLRAQLVGLFVVLLVAALAAAGWAVQMQTSRILVAQVDTQLELAAGPVAGGVVDRLRSTGGLDDDSTLFALPPRDLVPSTFVTQVTLFNGATKVVRPRIGTSLPASDPAFPSLTAEQVTAYSEPAPFTVGSQTGDARWRVVAVPIVTRREGTPVGAVFVATPLTSIDTALRTLRTVLVVVTFAGALLFGVIGWVAVRRAFRPLAEVEETAAGIAAGDLSRRIPERPTTTEVGRLTASLNTMLTHIESAFRAREASQARTRRFAADASHELRTPLASIRGFAELYRQGAVPTEDVPRTMRRIEDEATRMGGLVEDLLMLARLDEQRAGRSERVDLTVLAGDAVHDAKGLDPQRPVQLVGLRPGTGPTTAVVVGDEDRLRQVVANLVANAVRHTPPGTPVEVAVGVESAAAGPLAVLEVRDHGRGLTPEQAERIFERFYRVDSSRHRGRGGGSGLGLSIVHAVVTAHGGQVGVRTTPGGGASFRVGLPAAPAG